MKVIVKVLLGVLALVALVLVLALIAPREFESEKQIVIGKPANEIFEYVRFLKNQENYGVWYKMDPDMKKTFSGTDGEVGFAYEWDGKKMGKGRQVIAGITDGERMDTELYFMDPENPALSWMTVTEVSPAETNVAWGISGRMPYPTNLMNWFIDMGDDLGTGLENLKEIMESRVSVVPGSQEFLLDYFEKTSADLRKSVEALSEEQLKFQPAPDKWSVSQCLEHLVAAENMLFGWAKGAIEDPQNDEGLETAFADDGLVAVITNRDEKAEAPETLRFEGKYVDPTTAMGDFGKERQVVLDYIQSTPTDLLRTKKIDYPFGVVDGYQSLLFIAAHTARHTEQIEEIKSSADFPRD